MAFRGHHKVKKMSPDEGGPAWTSFRCAFCGELAAGAVVATYPHGESSQNPIRWLICTGCEKGSVENSDVVLPAPPFGPSIEGLPKAVADAYAEARRCMQVQAYTAAELLCRKLLMFVAADKGAAEGEKFAAYLSYLETNGYITPPMKRWVDLIRQHGNDATHKLDVPSRDRAEGTVMFTAELLRLVYEMEHLAAKYAPAPAQGPDA